jgi:hypothetical protein
MPGAHELIETHCRAWHHDRMTGKAVGRQGGPKEKVLERLPRASPCPMTVAAAASRVIEMDLMSLIVESPGEVGGKGIRLIGGLARPRCPVLSCSTRGLRSRTVAARHRADTRVVVAPQPGFDELGVLPNVCESQRPTTITLTCSAPAWRSVSAADCVLDPVVQVSSRTRMC